MNLADRRGPGVRCEHRTDALRPVPSRRALGAARPAFVQGRDLIIVASERNRTFGACIAPDLSPVSELGD
jgi:hypothetical protein